MTLKKRIFAYAASFVAGYGIPLVALAAVGDTMTNDPTTFHTSSRTLAHQADISADEMEALRLRLWALTENGDVKVCDGPCVDTIGMTDAH